MKHDDVDPLAVPRDERTNPGSRAAMTDRQLLESLLDQVAHIAETQARIEANVGMAMSAAHGMRDRVAALEGQVAELQRRELNGGSEAEAP